MSVRFFLAPAWDSVKFRGWICSRNMESAQESKHCLNPVDPGGDQKLFRRTVDAKKLLTVLIQKLFRPQDFQVCFVYG
jgi:hypothetical protein